MPGKEERRRQHRAERRRRRANRDRRARRGAAGRPGPAYVSTGWDDHGPHVWFVATRRTRPGRYRVGLFEADLRERGPLRAEVRSDVPERELPGVAARFAGLEVTLVEQPPALAARLLRAAEGLGGERPARWAEAAEVLRGVDPEGFPHEILVGPPPAPPSRRKGFLAWFFGG